MSFNRISGLIVTTLLAWPAPSWASALDLPGARELTLEEAAGRSVLSIYANGRVIAENSTSSAQRSQSDRVTVIVDGILMELPYGVVVGQIRNGTFVVVSGWSATLMWDTGLFGESVDCSQQPFHPDCLRGGGGAPGL